MLLKSPTDTPLHIALLSGHAILIGPEPREVDAMFVSHAIQAGAIEPDKPKRQRKPPAPEAALAEEGGGMTIEPDPTADDDL